MYEHPAVMEAGAIGVPDEFGGEVPQAYVVLRQATDPVSESQLIDFLRSRLPGYKVPTRITFSDNLPHGLRAKSTVRRYEKKR